jgi:glycosyltransferase involved in cell wall biosynthesis
VYRQISDSLYWAPTPARRTRVRVGLSRAARVVALWEGAAATLQSHFGVRATKLRVIPNGVVASRFSPGDSSARADARRVLGLLDDALVAVYVGALVPEKGVDVAIEAVGRAAGAQLAVVGSGPDDSRLRALAARVAAGSVVFTGSVADPLVAYRAADVLVLPSRGGDSMPAVVVEAALSGIPTITTPVGALPEMVVAGETGEVLPIGDVDALAGALRNFASSPETARALGRAAQARALERYTMDPVAAAWARLLGEVAG